MARLFLDQEPLTQYKDRAFKGSMDDYLDRLRSSATLYVGNVSFFTSEEQIWSLFAKCGVVKTVIMGLDKHKLTPCGFCFVEYHNRKDAERSVKYLNGTKLDDREVRIDFDWGFQDGRQFGRGKSGGQVRDEYRSNYDAGRGGYGVLIKNELETLNEKADAGTGEGDGFRGGGAGPGNVLPNKPYSPRDPGPAPKVGSKRGRDGDSDEEMEKENPRFRGDDSDED
jgi:RNA recognition motif-containing protein